MNIECGDFLITNEEDLNNFKKFLSKEQTDAAKSFLKDRKEEESEFYKLINLSKEEYLAKLISAVELKKRKYFKLKYPNDEISEIRIDFDKNDIGTSLALSFLKNEIDRQILLYNSMEKFLDRQISKLVKDTEEPIVKEVTKDDEEPMIKEVSLDEFRSTGLAMFVNQILHIFGYAIGFDVDEKTKEATRMIPLRVKFRGFSEDSINRNYEKLARYMKDHSEDLYKEAGYDK